MFKFKFSSDDKDESNDEGTCQQNDLKWKECKEVWPKNSSFIKNILGNAYCNSITTYEVKINYLCSNDVLKILRNGQSSDSDDISILKAEENHSDLLPAIYEGGLKIWECTYDLLNYIEDNQIAFENKKVLDLGCGAGIIGILSLLKGSTCYFQDYNSDVIEYITIPNVLLNVKEKLNQCKFYSGDWQSFTNLLVSEITDKSKFDYIFTSETIYNTENYFKLHQVFEKLLTNNGVIFLAAKSFYFGVGGGIPCFEEYLKKHRTFKYTSSWKCSEGIQREILKIEFNNSIH